MIYVFCIFVYIIKRIGNWVNLKKMVVCKVCNKETVHNTRMGELRTDSLYYSTIGIGYLSSGFKAAVAVAVVSE